MFGRTLILIFLGSAVPLRFWETPPFLCLIRRTRSGSQLPVYYGTRPPLVKQIFFSFLPSKTSGEGPAYTRPAFPLRFPA